MNLWLGALPTICLKSDLFWHGKRKGNTNHRHKVWDAVLEIVWVAEPKQSACSVKDPGHWPLVTWDDLNLFTDNPMKTSRFEQVVVGLCVDG